MKNTVKNFTRLKTLGLFCAASAFASQTFAACEYVVSNQWGSGFIANIQITNDSGSAVDGWQVSWSYENNSITGSWNADVSGSYTATNVRWNKTLQPGQIAEFGLQGVANGGAIEVPTLSGTLCDAVSPVPTIEPTAIPTATPTAIPTATPTAIPTAVPTATPTPVPTIAPTAVPTPEPTSVPNNEPNIALAATVTTSYVSSWETLSAVNDNSSPANSNDKSSGAYGNWNNPNSIQWVQYDFTQNYALSTTEVYWFDDDGGVLIPTTAYIEYWDGSSWLYAGDVPLVEDAFNALAFDDIETNRLRISMLNVEQSTGLLEWRVFGSPTSTVPVPTSEPTPTSAPTPTPTPIENDGPIGQTPYQAITNEYSRFSVNTSNALYMETDRFRAYYGGNGLNGGEGNLANVASDQIAFGLSHLESAYECLVNAWGFRSTSLSVNSDQGPYYKMNLYSTTTLNAGGAMGADANTGLSYIELKDNALNIPDIAVHEFGHSITYTAYSWVDQGRTGAWWESVANWVADTYNTDPLCEDVRTNNGLTRDRGTIIDLETTIASSHSLIVSTDNYYQAWPFLTYLTQNPDGINGIGRMAVKDLFDNHARNNETPLHVLERLVAPVSVQTVVGRYWARMAYLDIGHPKAQTLYFNARNNSGFRSRAFANLSDSGNGLYMVKADREPKYAGANITPLTVSGDGVVAVQITNLGNGLSDSNFTATLSILNSATGNTRYVDLIDGAGQASIASNEEVSLVVANTPDNLIQYNAFESTDSSPESIGLRYQAKITGAVPSSF